MPVVVEDVRMNLECMRDDRWSKEDAYREDVQGNPNTDNARYYGNRLSQ
jgi:hypothetical protein